MSYQFLPEAAIDITAFAKNTTGQVVIAKNRDVEVNNTYGVAKDALYYENGDFTTVNGFEFTLRTRRVSRLQTFASYTWSMREESTLIQILEQVICRKRL